MMHRRAAAVAAAASILVAASCGYPSFEFNSGGAGGHGVSSSSGAQSSSGSAGGAGGSGPSSSQSGAGGAMGPTTTGAATSGTGGGAPCAVNHVLISEIRSRGVNGGNDEFIELYNPTANAIPMDDSWSIQVRGWSSTTYATRWQGPMSQSISIPAHGHFLIAGGSYAQSPAPDVTISSAITADSASVLLIKLGVTVDAVCFAFGAAKVSAVAAFMCEGAPASNAPHDDSTAATSNLDTSIARGQNGCADSLDNATDFVVSHPAMPESTASALVP